MGRPDTTPEPLFDRMGAAVRTMVDRVATLAISIADAEAPVRATPGWSVTDVLVHLTADTARYAELVRGAGDWPSSVADLPAFNEQQISNARTRDVTALTVDLRDNADALLATVADFGDEAPLMWFDGGQRVRADLALGTILGELAVHGRDVASEFGHTRPITPEHVSLVMAGLHQVMPGWVDPVTAAGHTATYELRLRSLERHIYAFRNGKLTINPAERVKIDVHISSEPVTALLGTYGRIGQLWSAMTGNVIVWGRRAWLAPLLPGRFRSP